jgi:hypothetical protein
MINEVFVRFGMICIFIGITSCNSEAEFFGFNGDGSRLVQHQDSDQVAIISEERDSEDVESESEEIEICLTAEGSECDHPESSVASED